MNNLEYKWETNWKINLKSKTNQKINTITLG